MSQLVESLKGDKASLLRRQNALKNTNRNSSSSIGQIEAVPAQTNMHQRHPIPPEPTPTIRNESPNDANLLKIVHNYKVRLAAAEEEVARMRSEHENRPIPVPIPGSLNVDRDTLWKLQQLQTQHDHIQSKYAAQEEAYRKLDKDQLEYQQKVRDLRHALEDLRHEKSLIDTKAAKAESLQEAVDELKEANRALEKKYAQLCEVQYTLGDGMRSGMISRFDHEELVRLTYPTQALLQPYPIPIPTPIPTPTPTPISTPTPTPTPTTTPIPTPTSTPTPTPTPRSRIGMTWRVGSNTCRRLFGPTSPPSPLWRNRRPS